MLWLLAGGRGEFMGNHTFELRIALYRYSSTPKEKMHFVGCKGLGFRVSCLVWSLGEHLEPL